MSALYYFMVKLSCMEIKDVSQTLSCQPKVTAVLIVSFPELDGPRVRRDKDGAAEEGSQRGVEDGGEQSL